MTNSRMDEDWMKIFHRKEFLFRLHEENQSYEFPLNSVVQVHL